MYKNRTNACPIWMNVGLTSFFRMSKETVYVESPFYSLSFGEGISVLVLVFQIIIWNMQLLRRSTMRYSYQSNSKIGILC